MKYFKYLFFTTIAFCLLFFLSAFVFWIEKTDKIASPAPEIAKQETEQNDTKTIKIAVLDEESERIQRLSGRESLEKDKVMLFVFEEETYPGIWMKDMAFPIDIAWADKNGVIVYIERNVSPKTFPKVFFPSRKSLYVLETNAGFFDSHGFKVGDLVETSF